MQKPASPRIRPIPSPDKLATVALQYLAKFAASEAALRRVLQNRVRRAAQQHPNLAADRDAQAQLATAIEAIIDRHRAGGALNDAAYAEIKVQSLRRAGRSRRMISLKLNAQGVKGDVVAGALSTFDDGRAPETAEMIAAQSLARRRKLGPYRVTVPADDGLRRKADSKDFAALARAGFSMQVIKRVLGGNAIDIGDETDDACN